MRNQSNELIRIAKELRNHFDSLNIEVDEKIGENITLSNNLRVHYNPKNSYMHADLSTWPHTIMIAIFERNGYSNNTVTINVEKVTDEDLDNTVLLFSQDVATFMGSNMYKANVPAN
jgi:hypothetical protein